MMPWKLETLAIHAGRHPDPVTGSIATPIYPSTTFLRGEAGNYPSGFSYSREQNPNRKMLEECLAALYEGKEALVFASGLAVVHAAFQSLQTGDHVLATADIYYGVRKVAGDVFPKWPLEIAYVDMTDLDAVRAAIRPSTRLIWTETPSNPLLKITDLAAIAEIARKANAISICDNTFATPVYQRPFDSGIDMVMDSTTKYISGHSDVVGGSLVTRYDNYLFERARKMQRFGGSVPSPFDCWLTLRGIETLPWRLRAMTANAKLIVEFLLHHPAVEQVHYPGFSGMVSFQVKGGAKEAMDVTLRTRVFTRATSLGGTHSLIEHRASVEGPGSTTPENLLRMSVGLENHEDLIEDLAQALSALE